MKVDKYDRQIRLWGPRGQKKLSQAKIALLGCSGSGIQALKNLVLPGVGEIHIYDDEKVQIKDLCTSFFYEQDSVGKYKAEQALKNLLEMNPDVQGKAHIISVKDLIKNESSRQELKDYQLCISCLQENQTVLQLSKICHQNNIPLIFAFSIGFFFYIRNQKVHHNVQSSSSQQRIYYLRLNNPFQGLQKYSELWNIQQLLKSLPQNVSQQELKQHQNMKILGKIPYLVILMQLHQSLPQNQRNFKCYKQKLSKWIQKIHTDQRINFREAEAKIHNLTKGVQDFMEQNYDIFQHSEIKNANSQSSFFKQFIKAVSIFYEKFKYLPQPTKLPDMHTKTSLYIDLKNVYKKEHQNGKAQLIKILRQQFLITGQKIQENYQLISFYIENINGLQMCDMKPYFIQLNKINPDQLYQQKNTYIAIRVYQQFKNQNKNKYPKSQNLQQIIALTKQFCQINGISFQTIDQRFLKQICRSQGKQTIHINSMIGGIIAQEGIKLITNCFCPMMSGYVYNGIFSTGSQINLI